MLSVLAIASFWGLLLVCSLSRSGSIFTLLFVSMAFGTFSVVPPALTGGVTLLATPFVGIGLAFWVLRKRGAFGAAVAEATSPNGFLLLTLFTVFAVASAIVLPRLLSGAIYVMPVRVGSEGLSLLRPSSQNITQSLYLLVALVLALSSFLAARLQLMAVYRGAVIGGVVLIITGLADYAIGDSGLLDVFRTATYALNTGQTIGTTERIVGLMTEPASFGYVCVGFAALIHFLGAGLKRSRSAEFVSGWTVAGLVLMAILSTSSTAFVMLAVFGTLAVVSAVYKLIVNRQRLRREIVFTGMILGTCGTAFVFFAIAFAPSVIMPATGLIDEIIFQKVETDSFDERSGWNIAAWNAFLASNGLGVGIGSTKASSWPMVILSNTGALGFLLFHWFFLHILLVRSPFSDTVLKSRTSGPKLTLIVLSSGLTLAATGADFGGLIAICFGLILASRSEAQGSNSGEASASSRSKADYSSN